MLTSRQKQIRDFVKKIIKKNSVAPSEREIARHFRLSASTMHEHLETLRGKGYLQKARGRARSIRVIEPSNENLVRIPLLGRIAAGQPIEAIEDKETIVISQSKLPFSKGNYYALRVSGNSMVDENINNGRDFAIQGIALSVIQEEKPVATALPEHKRTEIERFAKLPLNQIICGDAVRIMQQMPEDSIDLTVTSPPYDELRNYNGYIFDFEGIAKNLFRITKKGGVVVWVVGDQTIKGDETGTSFMHALYF